MESLTDVGRGVPSRLPDRPPSCLFAATPVIRSAESGEEWSWCFVDEVAFVIEPGDVTA